VRIAEYWIVNLLDDVLEAYRDPVPDARAAFDWRYGHAELAAPPTALVPLSAPAAAIPVTDMLP